MAKPNWDKTLADAKKILGKDAKIPLRKMPTVQKEVTDLNKHQPSFAAARDAFEKQILEYQDAFSRLKNALVQADNDISDDDYGLDPKKPDDKKKIDQAQALFKGYFKDMEDEVDDEIKVMNEVDKHIDNARKYKGPS
jgi:hypothetical protein